MIMPFFRLVAIYVIVIVVVVAFFKRDQIIEMTGWSFAPDQSQQDTGPAAESGPEEKSDFSTDQPLIEQPLVSETTAEIGPKPPETAPEPAVTSVDVAPAPAATEPAEPVVRVQSRLNAARQAFWSGDLAGAEALYAALARDAPGNPDAIGELGNVFYAQRRFDQAAEAYLATGKLLVKTGDRGRVLQLINVLQSIAPQKAATLHGLLIN